jgi:hypothetical protein
MAKKLLTLVLSGNSSAAASTTTQGSTVGGFELADEWTFDVKVTGATGGTLDVYLQKLIVDPTSGANVWVDYIHCTQTAGGTTTKENYGSGETDNGPIAVGQGTDAAPAVALAAGKIAHGHPGKALRLVFVTGTGVSVAGSALVYCTGRNKH